jgi:predicted secreted Zn-dependent protease
MQLGITLAAAVVMACVSVAAQARPLFTTKYQYYSISGRTALEVYKSMLIHGPRVNGADAYAATSAQSSQTGYLVEDQNCRIRDYQFKINFVIQLPRMNNEGKLPPLIRSKWQQFSEFLKKHEQTHRAIWMGCAKEFETKIASIKAGDCERAQVEAAQLWDKISRACDLKHQAFDAAQQKLLPNQPFVKFVLGTSRSAMRAASIEPKRRKKTTAAALAR